MQDLSPPMSCGGSEYARTSTPDPRWPLPPPLASPGEFTDAEKPCPTANLAAYPAFFSLLAFRRQGPG
jgi:hypothetical protein